MYHLHTQFKMSFFAYDSIYCIKQYLKEESLLNGVALTRESVSCPRLYWWLQLSSSKWADLLQNLFFVPRKFSENTIYDSLKNNASMRFITVSNNLHIEHFIYWPLEKLLSSLFSSYKHCSLSHDQNINIPY